MYRQAWDYADPDSTGNNTIVIKLADSSDPDSKALGYVQYTPGDMANAISVTQGPIKVRFCYIHDNISRLRIGSFNSAGIHATELQQSIIEYNYFANNGVETGNSWSNNENCSHIMSYSDYDWSNWANNGISTWNGDHIWGNIIRYNYFDAGAAAIKYKGSQYLTGRTDGANYDDTYDEYGDKIHHNIFVNQERWVTNGRQDFLQFYNNIADSPVLGVHFPEDDISAFYKVAVYNNTLMSPGSDGIFFSHRDAWVDQEPKIYAFIVNNLIYDAGDGANWSDVTIDEDASGGNWYGGSADYTELIIDRNYHYMPETDGTYDTDGSKLVFLADTRKTAAEMEALYASTDLYVNTAAGSPTAFVNVAAEDEDRYLINSAHVVEGAKTLSDGGLGGSHPWLDAVTIPAYIGGVDPNDTGWVAGVLDMDVTWFTAQEAGSTPSFMGTPASEEVTITVGSGSYTMTVGSGSFTGVIP